MGETRMQKEILQRIAPEEKPQIMAKIEKKLYDWATKAQGVMIKTERDTFVYVFEQQYLEEMQNEKFSILDEKSGNCKAATLYTTHTSFTRH